MENINEIKSHSLNIENRNKITLTGVTDVGSFDEETLKVLTDCGEIEIKGENLQVTVLSLESGQFCAEGKINSLQYTDRIIKGGGFFSKVFR